MSREYMATRSPSAFDGYLHIDPDDVRHEHLARVPQCLAGLWPAVGSDH